MSKRIIAALLGLIALTSSAAMAAEPTKIAVANTAKIFSEMQELKDLKTKMESERKLLEGVDRETREKINALKSARDALKSDTPQYQDKNAELLKAAIEYETWGKLNQANFQREQKLQMKMLFKRIEDAVTEVAKQKGFDLVLTDQRPDLPDDIENISVDQLRSLINARSVLFASEKVDISNDVLAALDSKYRAGAKPAN
jgi:outer membrane protein